MADCNAYTYANSIFTSLTADSPKPVNVDASAYEFVRDSSSILYSTPNPVTITDLTESCLDGNGVFDKLMATVDLHIQREYKNNRLTGDQYAKAYTDVMVAVLREASTFLLSKDRAQWDAIQAQYAAQVAAIQQTVALVELENSKVALSKLQYEMATAGAQYALTKMQTANEDAKYCLLKAEEAASVYATTNLLPAQVNTLNKDISIKDYTLTNTLPAQLALIDEQKESERAKTLDTSTDTRGCCFDLPT